MKHAPNGERVWKFSFAIGTVGSVSHGWSAHTTKTRRPQTTDVKETRIDRVTSSLVGAQSLELSSFSCPTDCADHQPKCTHSTPHSTCEQYE